jgi:hypothetical protein
MAVVTLTLSRSEAGTQVADLLQGGSSGCDFGTVANDSVSATQELFLRHNGVNKITSCAYYIQPFSGVYGGAYDPSSDFAKILALGDVTPGNHGLLFDEDWNASPQFSSFYKIKTGSGDSFGTRRNFATSMQLYFNSGTSAKSDPSAPVVGEVGPNDNGAIAQAIGNRSLLRFRLSLPANEIDGGIRQFDTVIAYTYTS